MKAYVLFYFPVYLIVASYENKLNIKAWAEEDRPREKLIVQGRQALSNAELLAILIGSGSRDETAVALCQRLLSDFDQDLNVLGKLSIKQLTRYKGIGTAKALSIVAALELGRRRQSHEIRQKKQISGSRDAFEFLSPLLSDLAHEEFIALLLNRRNKVMFTDQISVGGVSGTIVDMKKLFLHAVEHQASAMIIAHNHPSGNLRPSEADRQLTRKVKKASELLDISLLDHLIVSEEGYFSFADEGLLQ